MSKSGPVILLAGTAYIMSCGFARGQTAPDLSILAGAQLAKGFFIGLNTSNNLTNWLSTENAADLLMQYPPGQAWGSVFLTDGQAVATNRPGIDVSAYQSLVLDLSGDPGTTVSVGIKDANQPDDGSETIIPLQVAGDWRTYSIPLARFSGANLTKIYVVTEFVFNGTQGQTLRVRNIGFTAAPLTTTMILPQFAFGGGWYSALYFTNTGGTASMRSMALSGRRRSVM